MRMNLMNVLIIDLSVVRYETAMHHYASTKCLNWVISKFARIDSVYSRLSRTRKLTPGRNRKNHPKECPKCVKGMT